MHCLLKMFALCSRLTHSHGCGCLLIEISGLQDVKASSPALKCSSPVNLRRCIPSTLCGLVISRG